MDSLTEDELCLYEILHHPVLFMEFITPVNKFAAAVLPLRNWLDTDNWGHVRLYQFPTLGWDHLLPDNVPIDSNGTGIDRKGTGTCYDWGGRSTSKSWGLIHDVLQYAIIRSGESSLVTSRDANHLNKRMDSIWNYIQEHPLIQALVLSKKKSEPYAIIHWWNSHKTVGVYESTSGQGDNYLGSKNHRVNIDEFQLTSAEAYKKLHDAKEEKGVVYRTTGVSDGRMDTPAHEIRNDPKESRYVHVKAQFLNEITWTPTNKEEAIRRYGGEDSQDYRTNVKAEEGDPTTGVWNMAHIQECLAILVQDRHKPKNNQRPVICPVVRISDSQITEHFKFSNIQFPTNRDYKLDVWLSMDVGSRAHPSVIGIWGIDTDMKPHLWGLVVLVQFDYDDQIKILEEMIRYYSISHVGIDATGADGTHITRKLRENARIMANIIGVNFGSVVEVEDLTGLEHSTAQRRGRRANDIKMRNLGVKYYTTQQLQIRFQQQRISLLYDARFMTELLTEVSKRSSGRMRTIPETYHGPQGDHTIDMMRVLEYMLYAVENASVVKKSNVEVLMRQGFIDLGVF